MARYVSFAGYDIASDTLTIVCRDVFQRSNAAKIIVHEHNGEFWVGCGVAHPEPSDYHIVCFGHVVNCLPAAVVLPLLKPGQEAEQIAGGSWKVRDLGADE